jgi:putative ABC transport system permease protein
VHRLKKGVAVFGYYLHLALRSLRRNPVLTALVIAAIGIGIGASMTMLTVLRAMSQDPMPRSSTRLFAPQIDNWGPGVTKGISGTSDGLPDQLNYQDAMALMRAHAAEHQAAMYRTVMAVTPPDPKQALFRAPARATYADFFTMFAVPFRYGSPWTAADDGSRAPLVVITRALNDRLFGGADSVGRTLRLGADGYRVTGVIDDWDPSPRFYDPGFYDLVGSRYGAAAQIFLPFTTAVGRHLSHLPGSMTCPPQDRLGTGEDAILRSECIWIQFWVELPTAAAVNGYRTFLHDYAAEQRREGRFDWPPRTALRNVRQWLVYRQAVPPEVRVLTGAAFSFLVVCLLNAMGLMLAKFIARAGSLGVRRALGADRAAIYGQCLMEAAAIGVAAGLLGVALTALGLISTRQLLPASYTRLEVGDVVLTVLLAVGTTLLAGLYPTWRASRVQPAWQLKSQ